MSLPDRLAARTLELIDVPSESRNEDDVAALVRDVLRDAGARDAGDTCVLAGTTERGDRPLVPGNVHAALMLPRQPAWIAFAVGSMTITASASRRPGSRSSSGVSALWTTGSSSRPKKT